MAEDKVGRYALSRSKHATRWCLLGAMYKLRTAPALTAYLEGRLYGTTIAAFNDSTKRYGHVRKFLEKVAKEK